MVGASSFDALAAVADAIEGEVIHTSSVDRFFRRKTAKEAARDSKQQQQQQQARQPRSTHIRNFYDGIDDDYFTVCSEMWETSGAFHTKDPKRRSYVGGATRLGDKTTGEWGIQC